MYMRKGDTLPPPEKRKLHGKATSVGVVEDGDWMDHDEQDESGEEGDKKRGAFLRLFQKNDKQVDKVEKDKAAEIT